MEMMMQDLDGEYRKLCWRSRRGMLELDRLLVPFVQEAYPQLSQPQKVLYQRLLEQEDIDLLDWLVHRLPPKNSELTPIVDLVVHHVSAP